MNNSPNDLSTKPKHTLKGLLKELFLPDIFQVFSDTRKTGTLKLFDEHSIKFVYFDHGEVKNVFSFPERRERLGELLIGKRKITRQDLQGAIKVQRQSGELLGKILVDMGKVSTEEIDDTERFQLEEEIFDLFSWETAGFEFYAEITPSRLFGRKSHRKNTRSINTERIIIEAARRIDEWESIPVTINAPEAIFKINEDRLAQLSLKRPHIKEVVGLLDGIRTVEGIVKQLSISKLEICKILHNLLKKEAIEPVGGTQSISVEELAKKEDQFHRLAKQDHTTAIAHGRKLALDYREAGLVWDARRICSAILGLRAGEIDLTQPLWDLLVDERD